LRARLRAGEECGREVVAVSVVQEVVRVLVVREQVLRDPDEDVEADRVRGELQPVVDPRIGGQISVRRLVHLGQSKIKNPHKATHGQGEADPSASATSRVANPASQATQA